MHRKLNEGVFLWRTAIVQCITFQCPELSFGEISSERLQLSGANRCVRIGMQIRINPWPRPIGNPRRINDGLLDESTVGSDVLNEIDKRDRRGFSSNANEQQEQKLHCRVYLQQNEVM
jgi:hypothetical protein